jgi:hypothetical protein
MVQFCYLFFRTELCRHAYSALLLIDWEGRDDAKCRSQGKRDELMKGSY